MARTNIDIHEELVTEVMRRFHLKTKREAVDFALRRAAGSTATTEGLLGLEGIGWDGDLDATVWPCDDDYVPTAEVTELRQRDLR